ncbi:MAG: M20 family metallo-hydrolase [Gammaproteobacteria bacterium]|nr:M20 family metallo-hydrolase [Gammaproteobacteria bacterium]
MNDLRVDGQRLWQNLMEMARVGATPAGGCNRQTLTDDDREGRDLFVRWCEEAGASVTVDAMGNIFARREGSDPSLPAIIAGSHLDTQPTGGKFDGVYGVLAALEVLRTLGDHGLTTRGPVEAVVWTNEEGARFAPAMVGSGVWSGEFDIQFAYSRTDQAGQTFGDELTRIGYCGVAEAKARPLRGAFEAHIEQGPILEQLGKTIGAVAGVQGMRWYDLALYGDACHAGPTPMADRRDPFRAQHLIVAAIYELAAQHGPEARVTFGDLKVEPGSRNTVPHTVTMSLDMRHPDQATLDRMDVVVRETVDRICKQYRLESSVVVQWDSAAITFDAGCVACVRDAAESLGYECERMVSGAGHDSVNLSKIAPTAMIFVPCAGGLSHNEAESATLEDLEAGCNVLLQAVLRRDQTT